MIIVYVHLGCLFCAIPCPPPGIAFPFSGNCFFPSSNHILLRSHLVLPGLCLTLTTSNWLRSRHIVKAQPIGILPWDFCERERGRESVPLWKWEPQFVKLRLPWWPFYFHVKEASFWWLKLKWTLKERKKGGSEQNLVTLKSLVPTVPETQVHCYLFQVLVVQISCNSVRYIQYCSYKFPICCSLFIVSIIHNQKHLD